MKSFRFISVSNATLYTSLFPHCLELNLLSNVIRCVFHSQIITYRKNFSIFIIFQIFYFPTSYSTFKPILKKLDFANRYFARKWDIPEVCSLQSYTVVLHQNSKILGKNCQLFSDNLFFLQVFHFLKLQNTTTQSTFELCVVLGGLILMEISSDSYPGFQQQTRGLRIYLTVE